MANETETPITDIDSAMNSILMPEETTEEVIKESQETEEISAEAEVADEVEVEEEELNEMRERAGLEVKVIHADKQDAEIKAFKSMAGL